MILWVGVKDLVSVFLSALWTMRSSCFTNERYVKDDTEKLCIAISPEYSLWGPKVQWKTLWSLNWKRVKPFGLWDEVIDNVRCRLTQSWYASFPQYCLAISVVIRTLWYGHKPLLCVWSEPEDHHLTVCRPSWEMSLICLLLREGLWRHGMVMHTSSLLPCACVIFTELFILFHSVCSL